MMADQRLGQLIEMETLNQREVAALAKAGLAIKVYLKPIKKRSKTWYCCHFVVESIRYKNNKQTQLVTMRGDTWMMFDLNRAIQHIMKIFPTTDSIELQLPRNMETGDGKEE
ncbi:MAG: hypothetical protein OEY58_19855 [Gammaproteobacteria bacterium]|nr:hypothetical protein [Gammaproteobacteria bacterium]